jgi:hypothetical protein
MTDLCNTQIEKNLLDFVLDIISRVMFCTTGDKT